MIQSKQTTTPHNGFVHNSEIRNNVLRIMFLYLDFAVFLLHFV